MKKHCIITVRYSVYDTSSTTSRWKIIRRNPHNPRYFQELFDPVRLQQRQHLFENVTLASLSKFNHSDFDTFTVYVITSTLLPDGNKKWLENRSDITVVYQAPDKVDFGYGIDNVVGPDDYYAHIRLDDDDGLLPQLGPVLARCCNKEHVGYIISPSCGIGAIVENGKIVKYGKIYEDYIGCGMCLIGSGDKRSNDNVYYVGHNNVKLHFPVVVLADDIYWIRTYHQHQDSNPGCPALMRAHTFEIQSIVNPSIVNINKNFIIKL